MSAPDGVEEVDKILGYANIRPQNFFWAFFLEYPNLTTRFRLSAVGSNPQGDSMAFGRWRYGEKCAPKDTERAQVTGLARPLPTPDTLSDSIEKNRADAWMIGANQRSGIS